MTTIPTRLAALDTITLGHGAHDDFTQGHCAMEVVAWLAGEGHTDAPACASKVLQRYTIRLNDRWGDEQRQALKPYLPRMVGTGDDGKDGLRERIAVRATVDLLTPWLRLAGLDTEADRLAGLSDAPAADVRRAVNDAASAAWALRRERVALIEAKVREHLHLAGRPVAAAVAVAVAAAVAVAVAAAAAAAKSYNTHSAAYMAAREYYREHPLPVTDQFAALAAEQQGAALDLLDRLIDPVDGA